MQSNGNPVLELYKALQSVSVTLGFIGTVAAFGIAWRISGAVVTAALVCSAFIGWNAFINYSQSGTAYVPGLSLQLVGLYLLLPDGDNQRPLWRAWLAALALALSVCLWFPYAVSLPGIFLLGFLWNQPAQDGFGLSSRARLRPIITSVTACLIFGLVAYVIGIWMADIHSVTGLREWITSSGHGYHPTRGYIRVATGLPRGLVEIGESGLVLKRFVLHDPYAHVGTRELLQAGLGRIVLFYLAFVGLFWVIYRDKEARPLAISLSATWLILLFFAVVVFEPSQSERWMPGFASLVAGFAFVFRKGRPLRLGTGLLGLLLAVIWLNNFRAYASPAQPGMENPSVARLTLLKPEMRKNNMIALLSMQDDISLFFGRFPFHPTRSDSVDYYFVAEQFVASSAEWRQRFARRALKAWQEDGEVWVTKRVSAETPLPQWNWAEGDDPNFKWRDIPLFFRQFDYDGKIGGYDGFQRIARNSANESRFEELAQER